MKKQLFLSLLGLLLCFSCKKDEPVGSDYIVFGHFYGECAGEGCVEIFKVQDGKLFEDSNDIYPDSKHPYIGNYHELSDTKYRLVKDLRRDVPAALLNETAHVIGTPDAGDWGGLYIEINSGSDTRYWLIDKMESNLPAYLVGFKKKVEDAIDLVK